jgi:hypothetical protein
MGVADALTVEMLCNVLFGLRYCCVGGLYCRHFAVSNAEAHTAVGHNTLVMLRLIQLLVTIH